MGDLLGEDLEEAAEVLGAVGNEHAGVVREVAESIKGHGIESPSQLEAILTENDKVGWDEK